MGKQLGTVLKSMFKNDDTDQQWRLELLRNWPAIVGDLHTQVTLEKIKGDTLVLGVPDASWLHELYLLSNVVIETINRHLDSDRIKHVRFKQVGRSKKSPTPRTTYQQAARRQRTLTTREETALGRVDDQGLQTALKDFLMRCS